MLKTLKRVSFASIVGGAFLISPFDTPIHKAINPYKARLYDTIRPSMFNILGPRITYELEYFLLSAEILPPIQTVYPTLNVTLPDGRQLQNPICLAAGYDKDGRALENLFGLGFAGVEIGSISPDQEDLTQKLKADIEKGTLESETYGDISGMLKTKSNLHSYNRKLLEREVAQGNVNKDLGSDRLIGINVMPNIETQESTPYLASLEFEQCSKEISEYAGYLLLNLSDMATEAISQYKSEQKLRDLIRKVKRIKTLETAYQVAYDYEKKVVLKDKVVEEQALENNAFHAIYNHYERNNPKPLNKTPLLLIKIDANLPKEVLGMMAKVALEEGLDGIVVGTWSKVVGSEVGSRGKIQKFFVGGKPNKEKANEALKHIYQLTQGKLTLISSGGVFDAKDVLERMKNGANLVQIYTSFVLHGPYMVSHLLDDLSMEAAKELKNNNLNNLNQLVGVDVKPKPKS